MVHPSEVKRREKRARQARRMRLAVEEFRAHGRAGDRYAGLDADAVDAAAALTEIIAGGAREQLALVDLRHEEHARRMAKFILAPPVQCGPDQPPPAGYENPFMGSASARATRLRALCLH